MLKVSAVTLTVVSAPPASASPSVKAPPKVKLTVWLPAITPFTDVAPPVVTLTVPPAEIKSISVLPVSTKVTASPVKLIAPSIALPGPSKSTV